jgi:5-formyltetrahydrofolate cyclo-ligase
VTTPTQEVLRRCALQARRELDDESRAAASRRIVGSFLRSAWFHAAANIGCYFPMWDEVDTSPVFSRTWQASKRIWCPVVANERRLHFIEVTRETRLRQSSFGLFEPEDGPSIDPFDLDVVVVPLVAFDAERHRIGMGGGYYDCTFARLSTRGNWQQPKLIGLAFDCQKVPKIKANPWDIPLFDVLTESR